MQKGLRVITLQGAIEKTFSSLIVLFRMRDISAFSLDVI